MKERERERERLRRRFTNSFLEGDSCPSLCNLTLLFEGSGAEESNHVITSEHLTRKKAFRHLLHILLFVSKQSLRSFVRLQ